MPRPPQKRRRVDSENIAEDVQDSPMDDADASEDIIVLEIVRPPVAEAMPDAAGAVRCGAVCECYAMIVPNCPCEGAVPCQNIQTIPECHCIRLSRGAFQEFLQEMREVHNEGTVVDITEDEDRAAHLGKDSIPEHRCCKLTAMEFEVFSKKMEHKFGEGSKREETHPSTREEQGVESAKIAVSIFF